MSHLPEPRPCRECGEIIALKDTYYRLMVAEHKNDSQWYRSKKRVGDSSVCADCYRAVVSALVSRRRTMEQGRNLGEWMAQRREAE